MPRTARPWYRVGRGQWYGRMDGKPVPLGVFGPDQQAAAVAAFAQLLGQMTKPAAGDSPPARADPPASVADAVAAFLAHRKARVKPVTLAAYARHCKIISREWGHLAAAALPAAAVEDFALGRATWARNQRRNFLATVELVLRHAGRAVKLDKPARESAGAESVIPEETHRLAVAAADGDLGPLLEYLWHTGCRPSEATGLTVDAVDREAGTARLREHKTRGKGKQRVVYLSPDALAVLAAQRAKHGAGLLFRSRRKTAFTMTGLAQQMCRISERIGRRVTAYGYRHSYCCRALSMGIPETHVAALMGHSSTRMISQHYGHLDSNARLLKGQADRISQADGKKSA